MAASESFDDIVWPGRTVRRALGAHAVVVIRTWQPAGARASGVGPEAPLKDAQASASMDSLIIPSTSSSTFLL